MISPHTRRAFRQSHFDITARPAARAIFERRQRVTTAKRHISHFYFFAEREGMAYGSFGSLATGR